MTAFINVMYKGGNSDTIRNLDMAEAEEKYKSLKSEGTAEVLELWRSGDPSKHDLELRYSEMLRAWDSVDGDLDVSKFCRKPVDMLSSNLFNTFSGCEAFNLK